MDEAYQKNTTSLEDGSSEGYLKQQCEKCGEKKSKMVTHHVSYSPEEVMEICTDCHLEIHQRPSEYNHLMPDVSRKDAKERGWI